MPLDLHCTSCAADTPVGQRVRMLTMDDVCPMCPWVERERTALRIIECKSAHSRAAIMSEVAFGRGQDEARIIDGMVRKVRIALAVRYGGVG
jgi:hypothetical protein